MTQRVIIEWGEDGVYNAFAPDMRNVPIGTGVTAGEAAQDFLNTVSEMRETYTEDGKPVPAELDADFTFQYDVSAVFSAFPFLNVTKTAETLGINSSLMRLYSSGGKRLSRRRKQEIEDGLHRIGRQLQDLSIA